MPRVRVMWLIYDHPKDYPDKCVARKCVIVDGKPMPTEELLEAATLAELRALKPPGLYRIRVPEIEPGCIERWL